MADRGLDQSIQPMVASNAVGAKEETYLKFRLDAQTAAVIPARSIQEAFILPARQLTAMPNLPAALLGLTNRRNQIIWVVDLAQLLGLSIFDASTRQYNLLLIQVGMLQLGLAVHGIEGMVRLSTDRIQAPIGQMSVSLLPYLQGCTWTSQNDQPEILLVLDAEAITQSPILNSG
ncbi:MAG: chemotaxis protein CheW [Elainella sp. Prado103]|jgi:twitching motility protein PilI|nr:chemotaxis protein CheW [Elainella sp. Prado103]